MKDTKKQSTAQDSLCHFLGGDSLFRRVLLHEAVGEKRYRSIMNKIKKKLEKKDAR